MNEVLPRLFIGGEPDTEINDLKCNKIETVLTIMNVDLTEKSSDVSYYWFKLYDMPKAEMKKIVPEAIKLISDAILLGNILVHCQVGMSRSVSIVISYMVIVLGFTVDQSLKVIRERRPWACPNNGFMDQLMELQQEVLDGKWKDNSYIQTAQFHHDLIKKRQAYSIQEYATSEAALQQKIKERLAMKENESNVLPELLTKKDENVFRCKKCRKILFSSQNLEFHQQGNSDSALYGSKGINVCVKECTSYFLDSDLEWLPRSEGVLAGKINCDKCGYKIGNFNWSATQCSCGIWITPAFQVHKSKVDKA